MDTDPSFLPSLFAQTVVHVQHTIYIA